MKNKKSISIGGIFIPMLQILFIYLKLTGQIDWSWFWVMSPLILGAIFGMGILFIGLLIALIASLLS